MNVYGFHLLWPFNYIIFRFPLQFLDSQKLSRAPSPFGPVCSACWQPRTERWHSDPPLHRPEWEAGRTNSRHSLVNLQASCVMTPMSSQKKYYLDQLRCRSDYRRAELADLMRERGGGNVCKHQKSWHAQMKLWLTVHLTFNQASMSAKRISSHSSALARLN